MSEPTPIEVRELAARAAALADDLAALFARADAGSPVRLALTMLDHAASEISGHAREIGAAATDLARIRVVDRDPVACGIPWGVCPEHANTLRSSGGRSWCTANGCGREWGYDRLTIPCAEPVAVEVTDATGAMHRMCAAHGRDAAARLDSAVVTPLTGEQP